MSTKKKKLKRAARRARFASAIRAGHSPVRAALEAGDTRGLERHQRALIEAHAGRGIRRAGQPTQGADAASMAARLAHRGAAQSRAALPLVRLRAHSHADKRAYRTLARFNALVRALSDGTVNSTSDAIAHVLNGIRQQSELDYYVVQSLRYAQLAAGHHCPDKRAALAAKAREYRSRARLAQGGYTPPTRFDTSLSAAYQKALD